MRKAPLFVAFSLLAATGPAAPQAPAPAPASAQSSEPAATPGTRLKLRLDDTRPSRPAITFGPREGGEQSPASSLPSLGGSSRSFDPPSGSQPKSDASSTYPKDADRERQ